MRVLVAEPVGEPGLALLRGNHEVEILLGLSRDRLLAELPRFEGLIVRSGLKVDAEAIAAGTRLLVIGRAGVGTDNIDLAAATDAGIAVVNAPNANTIAAAEHTLALILSLARRVPAADASLRNGEWRRADFVGSELSGKTLGIVGLGRIGLAVADRARAFGMRLLGSDPIVTRDASLLHGVELSDVDDLLAASDIVTLHVPLNDRTRGMLDAAGLSRMKRGALLVNVARGGLVDESALAEALSVGRLGGAALDVYGNEPPLGSPILTAPNTVLTPHLGASTTEAQERVSIETCEQVADILEGRDAPFVVNAPLLNRRPHPEPAISGAG
ncbi:MAG TPA: hydroxyacid dehydrogenase [Candidatus Limnocylindrales bacterium]|nr:hydroxyacid dehydrogenase [Candidatus Limnocylindrales bacterium]